MNTYRAELKNRQGANYHLHATSPAELAEKLARKVGSKEPFADFAAISKLAEEPDYLSFWDGWSAKVWKD